MFERFSIVFASILLWPTLAMGHGGPPLARHLFEIPAESTWVLATSFGVMTGDATGHYVCEEAFLGSDQFLVLPLSSREWMTFTGGAVHHTMDGCSFTKVFELPARPAQVASHIESARIAYALNDADQGGIWYADGDPRALRRLNLDLGGLRLTGVAFRGPDRLVITAHESAQQTRGAARLFDVAIGDEILTELPIEPGYTYPFLLTADPEGFVWHARRDDLTSIFWASDEDPQWRVHQTPQWPSAAAFDAARDRVWLAGIDDEGRGVFTWDFGDLPGLRTVLPGHSGLCLTMTGEGLIVCGQRDRDGHDLGVLRGDRVEALVDFRDLQGPRQDCLATSQAAVTCPALWPELARYLGIKAGAEAEEPGPSLDEDNGDEEQPGCQVAGGAPGSSGGWLLMLFACLAWVIRGRKSGGEGSGGPVSVGISG